MTVVTPSALGPVIEEEYPEAICMTRVFSRKNVLIRNKERKFIESEIFFADPEIFRMFTIQFLRGNSNTALLEPNSIVMTEKAARKYYSLIFYSLMTISTKLILH